MAILLANAPTDVETCKIAGCERSHGHAEVIKRIVHSLDARPFFDEKCCLANVRMKHAVPDKSSAIAHQHAHFAQRLGELHARSNDGFVGFFAAHDFQQPHYISWTKEMSANYEFRP